MKNAHKRLILATQTFFKIETFYAASFVGVAAIALYGSVLFVA